MKRYRLGLELATGNGWTLSVHLWRWTLFLDRTKPSPVIDPGVLLQEYEALRTNGRAKAGAVRELIRKHGVTRAQLYRLYGKSGYTRANGKS